MENKGNSQDSPGNAPGDRQLFGPRKTEDNLYDIYKKEDVGDYVVIAYNGNISSGKLIRIVDDVALLRPFQGMDYSKGYPQYILYDDGRHQKVPLKDVKITPLTEQSLKDFMAHENAEIDKKRKEGRSKKRGH